jgi:REP element-mobilizing transposase RayT
MMAPAPNSIAASPMSVPVFKINKGCNTIASKLLFLMRKTTSQLKFTGELFKTQLASGGSLHGGANTNPKKARIVSTKHPMHIVIRSSKATGAASMRSAKHFASVRGITENEAGRQGVKIVRFSNVGNHLHLLIRLRNRLTLRRFLRALCGRLAMRLSGAKKGHPLTRKFWDFRPFSRVVIGLRGFKAAMTYIEMNAFEAMGVRSRRQADKMSATDST